ncbi:hypothetical protein SAMD00019534_122860 [Acytostelium subglobosum LB1]|uniref:hypothetical protein n=1 Tax=Acytostelium subglobosum LB1 TaxID=1410327 RepID=UPI0006448DF1|nr:hypothetical protein SAMD00019534_122860 [Acytostelium subglobosum LB1]GAM29110.1 hypothetical protein SAMD00019534_122860 [Acytostelium subglobosum LB1]|eukprot:XP_012747955.1 hypothetical protein SAMD00019534_122860 [Acytostelium subglobosum LB1]
MSSLKQANGLFYFASDMTEGSSYSNDQWKIKLPSPDKQITVIYGVESPLNPYGYCFRTPGCIEYFNWTIGYMPRPFNDLRESYFHTEDYDKFLAQELETPFNFQTNVMASKEPGKVASWLNSQCEALNGNGKDSDRVEFMRRVMSKIHVDSYGSCIHNANMPPGGDRGGHDIFEAKIKVIKKYKFYFALENSNCPHYITEKVLHCLFNGVVPVYLGHETTLQYMPPGSYIYAKDFNSTQDLVDRLNYLDHNDTEYRKYFAWREDINVVKQWSSAFSVNDPMCDLYRLYTQFQNNMDTFPRKHASADPEILDQLID